MTQLQVRIEYRTSLKSFNVLSLHLIGSWDVLGCFSEMWTSIPMIPFESEDGCQSFFANVSLDDQELGREFRWGVTLDTAWETNIWGIPTELNDIHSTDCYRSFTLQGDGQTECFYLTHCHRLGANKHFISGSASMAIRFATWAPNAAEVELIWGDAFSGYISNNGQGAIGEAISLSAEGDGIWSVIIPGFTQYDHAPYMYKIVRKNGAITYRTDIYSRCQIGSGGKNPAKSSDVLWNGTAEDLDGTVSCSVVIDPERVTAVFKEADAQGQPIYPPTQWIDNTTFWENEFSDQHPLPERISDIVIYELHVDGLGAGKTARGTFQEAIEHLDYLVEMGVNCIELMPTSEFSGYTDWGYKTSHFMAIEYAAGGRDQLKYFVRECHRRGIAVLMDVVYNHYAHDAQRAEWAYDSDIPEENIYFWYEGRAGDYPKFADGTGGYIDNMSTGYAPRFHEEMVRKLFISSAAMLIQEFHIDGFRVDQTTSLHAYAVIHANGRPAMNARIFGAKFLREWTRTLRLLKPGVFLIAEDHSGWNAVTQPVDAGGLGFDATWFAEYYHQLIGDASDHSAHARLLKHVGYGDKQPLAMDWLAGTLEATTMRQVIYHESHDEAGNSKYRVGDHEESSARTIAVAVNNAPLVGDTRRYAEARVRVTAGLTLLARGIPMFFMGEEVGAKEPYRYYDFLQHRENFVELKENIGALLFLFYKNLIELRQSYASFHSDNFSIVHVHNENRIVAFRRWATNEDFLIFTSLNNNAFTNGYWFQLDHVFSGSWVEIFNSDDISFGGEGVVNSHSILCQYGVLNANIPANGIVVLERIR